jgi:uncharacterized membrane protein
VFTTIQDVPHAFGINDAGEIVGRAILVGVIDSGGVITTFVVPGAILTEPRGVNDAGLIVGRFSDSHGHLHGFLRDTGGAISEVDVPGALETDAYGISDAGAIVGAFNDGTRVLRFRRYGR